MPEIILCFLQKFYTKLRIIYVPKILQCQKLCDFLKQFIIKCGKDFQILH